MFTPRRFLRLTKSRFSRLMTKLFELIEQGHVKPIAPINRFSYLDIPSAIRFLRAGKHIGKIVISAGSETGIKVPVRQPLPSILFACGILMFAGKKSTQVPRSSQSYLLLDRWWSQGSLRFSCRVPG